MNINWKIKIITKRFVVRPLLASDQTAWLSSCKKASKSKNPWDLGRRKNSELTPAGFLKVLSKQRTAAKNDDCYDYHIFDKVSGEHCGSINFKKMQRDKYVSCVNLGYSIHNHLWGKGIAREAVKSFYPVAFTKLKFHRIEASMDPKNHKSQKVAKAAGFRLEGKRYGFLRWNGKWTDLIVYSKVR